MRSNLDQAVRRQILAAMGIDVWVPRTGARADRLPPAPRSGAESNAVAGTARADFPAQAASQRAGAGEAARPAEQPGAQSDAREAPFSVVSLSTPGVLLLLARVPSGREARLARDLLGAVVGRWDVVPAVRRFDWPPAVALPGVTGRDAGGRALRAFVEKDLTDHGCTLVMVEDGLADRLDTLRHAAVRVMIPDLARLGRDSTEKRRLWALLCMHCQDGARVVAGSAPPDADAP